MLGTVCCYNADHLVLNKKVHTIGLQAVVRCIQIPMYILNYHKYKICLREGSLKNSLMVMLLSANSHYIEAAIRNELYTLLGSRYKRFFVHTITDIVL